MLKRLASLGAGNDASVAKGTEQIVVRAKGEMVPSLGCRLFNLSSMSHRIVEMFV